jgi:hypothetical protein
MKHWLPDTNPCSIQAARVEAACATCEGGNRPLCANARRDRCPRTRCGVLFGLGPLLAGLIGCWLLFLNHPSYQAVLESEETTLRESGPAHGSDQIDRYS